MKSFFPNFSNQAAYELYNYFLEVVPETNSGKLAEMFVLAGKPVTDALMKVRQFWILEMGWYTSWSSGVKPTRILMQVNHRYSNDKCIGTIATSALIG